MDKFATALRLRWPWFEWKEPNKLWVGHGNPCSKADMNIFYAATSIKIGNGGKTPFWHAPWLQGRKPIKIAPLIFDLSKRKQWSVKLAMDDNAWIRSVRLVENFSMEHLTQFVNLWVLLLEVELDPNVEDYITWKLTEDGHYSAASAYEVQFLGATLSNMSTMGWKAWAPPKTNFFCLACPKK